MIGLLCTSGKEEKYSALFHSIFKSASRNKNEAIVIFTVNNIDFSNKTFKGSLISGESIKPINFKLPSVIFNLSIQHKPSDIKKIRTLFDMDDFTLVNEVNRFNQLMLMEMLSSSESLIKYVLPFTKYTGGTLYTLFKEPSSILIMPQKGSSFSKIIYLEQLNSDIDSFIDDINNKVNFILPKNYSLALKSPKLLSYRNHIPIFRIYVQKGINGIWRLLTSTVNLKEADAPQSSLKELQTIALESINYISKFIPNLGNCFIDFVLATQGNPYFMHLGGWDHKLFSAKLDQSIQKEFCENLINYADFCVSLQGRN
ncbi:hypothetical protein GOM49_12935 [Clostridium bovifaecis]|uniref:ATP-grasp domain-containing protein n=1 Tax=Clostridium bovifaecis TaxID=2184719 RepID=A0A6I6F3W1_9CLOT|nr:hypothetical protein GOM49_12935 [Clostridium bovifaecis]